MSEKGERRWGETQTCAMCARISRKDMERRYCPVTAKHIHPGCPADACIFFVKDERWRSDGRTKWRRGDVREE